MIQLRETQHYLCFSRFEMQSGESEDALEVIGFVEIRMNGSMAGLNGEFTLLDKDGTRKNGGNLRLGDGSRDTLSREAQRVVASGFPDEDVRLAARPE
jgi:hypothetical protein